jgi:predicted DNA-binding protein
MTYDKTLRVRINKPLYEGLENYAKESGKKLSFISRVVIEAGLEARNIERLKDKVVINREMKEEFLRLRTDLSKVGGNLNQIAMLLNMGIVKDQKLDQLVAVNNGLSERFEELMSVLITFEEQMRDF